MLLLIGEIHGTRQDSRDHTLCVAKHMDVKVVNVSDRN